MFNHGFFISTIKIGTRALVDFFYFPLWWYGAGLVGFLRGLGRFLRDRESLLGLSVWLKNIFVPMYGQRDIGGRIISFVMRLIQVIFRSLALIFWCLMAILAFLFWLALPLILFLALGAQFASLGALIN